MIQKYYEVTCDYCGRALNHYISKRPSNELLRDDGFVTTATKHFCDIECWGNWNHDRQQRIYLNLHPNGKIHHEK